MSVPELLRGAGEWALGGHPMVLVGVRATLILSTAFAACALLRKAPAWHRHTVWTCALVGVLLLPLLTPALPTLALPVLRGDVAENRADAGASPVRAVPPVAPGTVVPAEGVVTSAGVAEGAATSAGVAASAPVRTSWRTRSLPALPWGVWVWVLGAMSALIAVVRGLVQAERMVRRAIALDDPSWRTLLEGARTSLGLRRSVRLKMADDVPTPMTGGALRPVVLLPSEAHDWTPERRRLVLQHELTHIARHDWLRQLLAQVVRALHWPNPLAWLAVRAAHDAREAACDEHVLALGTRPSTYAGHLLAIGEAQALRMRLPCAALPMIDRSQLERRVMAILDSSSTSRRRAVLGMLVAALVGGAVLTVAAAQPAIRGGGLVPGVLPLIQSVPLVALGVAPGDVCLGTGDSGTFHGRWSDKDGDGFFGFSGTHNGDRLFQRRLEGGAKLCIRSHLDVDLQEVAGDLRLSAGTWMKLATVGDGATLVAEMVGKGGAPEITFSVDGEPRLLDATSRAWIEQSLAVAAGVQAIHSLRGKEAGLRGEIAGVRGEAAGLRGEIAGIHGEKASLRGEIASLRGKRASTDGEIASIRGELASLRGEIAGHRGEIANLRHGAIHEDDREVVDAAIASHEEEIRKLQSKIEDFDVEGRIAAVDRSFSDAELARQVAEVEARIATLDVEGRVAEIEGDLVALDVEGETARIERKIEALDADRRVAAMEAELAPKMEALERTLAELGC